MGLINKLFSKKKVEHEISQEEKNRLQELLNEKKLAEEEFDEEYIDDISFPENKIVKQEVSNNQNKIEKVVIKDKKENIENISINKENKNVNTLKSNEVKEKKTQNNNENKVNNLSQEIEAKISMYKFVDKLDAVEISKIKELIDKRERELEERNSSNSHNVSNKKKVQEIKDDSLEFEDHYEVKKKDFDIYKTSEYGVDAIDNINTSRRNTAPIVSAKINLERNVEEVIVLDDNEEEKNAHEINAYIINRLRDIFSDENLFYRVSTKINYDILNGKEVTCIGVRRKDAYYNWQSISEQTAWFISEIKKVNEVKNFKIIKSEDGIRDLVWNKDEHPILICFKSVELLPNQDEFNFPEK